MIERNVKYIAEYGGLVELNTRGIKKAGIMYPEWKICQYMQECGVRFTLSDDSHACIDVARDYDSLYLVLKRLNINEVYSPGAGFGPAVVHRDIINHPFWNKYQ